MQRSPSGLLDHMRYKYGKYIADPLDELDMDELMSKLSDLLLSSGFADPQFSGSEDERSMQALYDAILEALLSGGVLPEGTLKELLGDQADAEAAGAARAADPADHRPHAGERVHHPRSAARRRAGDPRGCDGAGAGPRPAPAGSR